MIIRVTLILVVLSTSVADSAKFKVCHKPSSCISYKECSNRHSSRIVVAKCINHHPTKVCCPPKGSDIDEKSQTLSFISRHKNYNMLRVDENSCGLDFSNKINKGNNADVHQFPWMVFLKFKIENDSKICGGSLIHKKYVMTAAHCFNSSYPNGGLESVRLGEYDYSTDVDVFDDVTYTHVEAPIEEVILHEKWNSKTLKNDIALIRLGSYKQDPDKNPFIFPICLPLHKNELTWDFQIAGWGLNDPHHAQKTKLQFGQMRRITMDNCKRSLGYKKKHDYYPSDTKQICAIEMTNTGDKDNQNVCPGDSGGPLMMYQKDSNQINQMFAVGIVSWQKTTCFEAYNFPSVFTNVENYIEWILDHISE